MRVFPGWLSVRDIEDVEDRRSYAYNTNLASYVVLQQGKHVLDSTSQFNYDTNVKLNENRTMISGYGEEKENAVLAIQEYRISSIKRPTSNKRPL